MRKKKPGPYRNHLAPESFYQQLDTGIRFAVRLLHAHGFDTCQSCQGGKEHAYLEPTVEMVCGASESRGFGALSVLRDYGLPVKEISIQWPIGNGLPYEKKWRITFWKTMEERADEIPIFIYSYQAMPIRRNP